MENWIITRERGMEILKPTKLGYLNYEDLITLNALHNAMQYVEHICEVRDVSYIGSRDGAQSFKDFFLADIGPGEEVLLITDPLHDEKVLAYFKTEDLFDVCNWYEATLKWSFFDYSDYCLIIPRLNLIKFLHDEPIVIVYKVD